jgi:hypothetical protein
MNGGVRSALVDLASSRRRPDDPDEQLFPLSYRQTQILFAQAVERAQGTLRDAGQDPSRLDGFTWHGGRHTFASRPGWLWSAWTSGRSRSSAAGGPWPWFSGMLIWLKATFGLPWSGWRAAWKLD